MNRWHVPCGARQWTEDPRLAQRARCPSWACRGSGTSHALIITAAAQPQRADYLAAGIALMATLRPVRDACRHCGSRKPAGWNQPTAHAMTTPPHADRYGLLPLTEPPTAILIHTALPAAVDQ
jgi:hypothetical protein